MTFRAPRFLETLVTGVRHLAGTSRVGPRAVSYDERAAATKRFFARLGLGPAARADEERVRDVICDYFALDAAGAEALRERIESKLAAKSTLGELVATVERDLVERYEPVSQLLAVVDLEPFVGSPHVRQLALDVAHQAYVLDAIVHTMLEDERFSIELRKHLYRAREATGVTLGRIREMTGIFGVLKVLSIDMCFKDLLGIPMGVERMRSKDQLSVDGFLSLWSGVPLNITEAMVTEFFGESYDNAVAGLRLAAAAPAGGRLAGENKEVFLRYPEGWSTLYESWNLLFVLSHVPAPHLLIAKLLIPSVTSAENENFIYRRLLALWLSIQSYILVRHRTNAGDVDLRLDPAWVADVKKTWGRINRDHAERFAKRDGSTNDAAKRARSLLVDEHQRPREEPRQALT